MVIIPKRPAVICLDGVDGCGKTTVYNSLMELLPKEHFVFTSAFGTPLAQELRNLLKSQTLITETQLGLINTSLVDTTKLIIEPALKAGKVVIMDRGWLSQVVYQGNTEVNVPQWSIRIDDWETVVKPTNVILNLDDEMIAARIANRGTTDVIEARGFEYLKGIAKRFRSVELASRAGGWFDTQYVNANQTPEEVLGNVIRIIRNKVS